MTKASVTQLVEIRGQQATTTSIAVAVGCKMDHKTVIRLIRKYLADFEELGQLRFESSVVSSHGAGQATEYAILNEDQATYAITLFRNSPVVRRFKLSLVKAFRKALNEIARLYANPPRSDLIRAKRDSNHILTDSILEWRTDHDKETDAVHYMAEQKLCNWAVTGQFKKADESAMSNEEIELLRLVRERNASLIVAGIEYPERKTRIAQYAIRQRTKLITGPTRL